MAWWWIVGAHAGTCALAPVDSRISAPGLAFTPRTAELTPAARVALDEVACSLAADPELRLHVEVHTDSMGADTYNLAMSQRRADAVRDALLGRGVDPARVAASGCGEVYPLAPNTTAEGRARNARIELWAPAPPDRAACPPVDVSALPPPPAPEPTAPTPSWPTDCAAWTALSSARPPAWSGLSCRSEAGAWTCTAATTPAELVASASACFEGRWDGPQWLAARPGWALVVGPGGSGAELSAR